MPILIAFGIVGLGFLIGWAISEWFDDGLDD
jgi:hypothetical protein